MLGELAQDACLGLYVVEDQAVGDQMVVLDQLTLPVAVVLGDQPLATEEEPLNEAVERLALVGRGLNDAAKLGVVEVPQQEGGPDDTAQLLEGLIEPVLPAVGPELTQSDRSKRRSPDVQGPQPVEAVDEVLEVCQRRSPRIFSDGVPRAAPGGAINGEDAIELSRPPSPGA